MTDIEARRAGVRALRAPALLLLLILLVFGILAALIWKIAWRRVDVDVVGTYRTEVLDSAAASATWAEMYPASPALAPPGRKTLTEIRWTDQQRVYWPAPECEFIVLLTHAPEASTLGILGDRFSQGLSGVIGKSLEQYPEIPRRINNFGSAEFMGSAFIIDAGAGREVLKVLLNWSTETPLLVTVRAGVLFACDHSPIKFEWLSEP
ncbi:hypothetical protein [Polymorphospora rubra]|uniref:hypothetical protein n=1 Tax=Polymorphospora rubra TaxID=338584 RepID=UPI0033F6DD01